MSRHLHISLLRLPHLPRWWPRKGTKAQGLICTEELQFVEYYFASLYDNTARRKHRAKDIAHTPVHRLIACSACRRGGRSLQANSRARAARFAERRCSGRCSACRSQCRAATAGATPHVMQNRVDETGQGDHAAHNGAQRGEELEKGD